MDELLRMIERTDPERALSSISATLKKLLPLVDEKARTRFIMDLVGETGDDKVSSLVHL
jgi:hypothetical protein